jgi:hypothetical protein
MRIGWQRKPQRIFRKVFLKSENRKRPFSNGGKIPSRGLNLIICPALFRHGAGGGGTVVFGVDDQSVSRAARARV